MNVVGYRLTPKGCLFCAAMEASEKIADYAAQNDNDLISHYTDILYDTFEEIMLENDYRIINIQDMKDAGIFE